MKKVFGILLLVIAMLLTATMAILDTTMLPAPIRILLLIGIVGCLFVGLDLVLPDDTDKTRFS